MLYDVYDTYNTQIDNAKSDIPSKTDSLPENTNVECASERLTTLPYKTSYTSIFKVTQIWTVKGNKAYTISYANLAKEPHLPPIVQRMIDSFEITTQEQISNYAEALPDFIPYEHPNFGMKIEYPYDWIADERNSIPSKNEQYHEIVGFLSPKEDSSDLLGELEERLAIETKVISSTNVSLED